MLCREFSKFWSKTKHTKKLLNIWGSILQSTEGGESGAIIEKKKWRKETTEAEGTEEDRKAMGEGPCPEVSIFEQIFHLNEILSSERR